MSSDRIIAAQLLKKMLSGELSPAQVQEQWPCDDGTNTDEELSFALHATYHYEADADIRARDPKYKAWQESEIREFIKEFMKS